MYLVLPDDLARQYVLDRQRGAALDGRAARVVAARRLQRKAETASRRARLALLAVR